jgi:hypothetical protein
LVTNNLLIEMRTTPNFTIIFEMQNAEKKDRYDSSKTWNKK